MIRANPAFILNSLLLSLCLILSSCEFEPTGENFNDIAEPDLQNPIEIELDLQSDTIICYWTEIVKLKINLHGKKIYLIKFFLNNSELINYTVNDNEYTVYLPLYNSGTYKFKFAIITSTGTNSIADALSMEGIISESKEWIFIVKPLNSNIKYSFLPEGLKLSWKNYEGNYFSHYSLSEYYSGKNKTTTENSILIDNYVGETVAYAISLEDSRGYKHSWGGVSLEKNLPVLMLERTNDEVILKWKNSRFLRNIAEYRLYERRSGQSEFTKINTIDPYDTLFYPTINPGIFAESRFYYLSCIPKTGEPNNEVNFRTDYFVINLALKGPVFSNPTGFSNTGFYFAKTDNESKNCLYKYSSNTDLISKVENVVNPVCISQNAKLLVTKASSLIELFNLETNNKINDLDISTYFPNYSTGALTSVSNNGLITFRLGNSLLIYDMINKIPLISKDIPGSIFKISPNGSRLIVTTPDSIKVLSLSGNSLVYNSGLKSGQILKSQHIDFLPGDDASLYFYVSPDLSFFSSTDGTVEKSFNIGKYFFNIDFYSRKILTANGLEYWHIYDLDSGSLNKSIRSEFGAGNPGYTVLINDTIYYSGYKHSIKD